MPIAAKPSTTFIRRRIQVSGVVQGVGFRPFVYNLAQELALSGYTLNPSAGVTIEPEGDPDKIESFLHTLKRDPPPLAQIAEIVVFEIEPNGDTQFSIRKSFSREGELSLVPADVGTCGDCWRDFTDPSNRRFGYAFTNCTNCGSALHDRQGRSLRPSFDNDGVVHDAPGVPGGIRRSTEPPLPCAAQCLPSLRPATFTGQVGRSHLSKNCRSHTGPRSLETRADCCREGPGRFLAGVRRYQ